MGTGGALFSSETWFDVRDQRRAALQQEINGVDSDRLLNTGVDDWVKYFEEISDLDVPVLDREQITVDQREVTKHLRDYGRDIVVTTTEIEVTVPFNGTSDAFHIQPSMYTTCPPEARVASNAVTFWVDAHQRTSDQVKAEIDRTLDLIEKQLSNLRANVEEYKREVAPMARELIERRRKKLMADKSLVSSLGYKLREREGVPKTYAVQEVRRKVAPRQPKAGRTAATLEPVLADAEYDHILKVLSDMAIVIERSPSAFETLGEEALRFLFLVPLNGHYEGAAAGEVFNFEGKTDILIRDNGKNIFIAECKFWGGPQKLTETIDQLLGYTSWRDTKTAVIIFNTNKDFSKVLAAIPPEVTKHPCYVKSLKKTETTFRYVFAHPNDEDRHLTLTVMAFDVPRA